jgi:hypothetical protein
MGDNFGESLDLNRIYCVLLSRLCHHPVKMAAAKVENPSASQETKVPLPIVNVFLAGARGVGKHAIATQVAFPFPL